MSESVRAVERALDILLCFTHDGPVLSLTQISEQVGMHQSTVHRLLATLESRRFVHRDRATGFYRLGFRFIEMASLVLQDVDLRRWAQPYLQRLAAECGETVDLAVLDGAHVIYLDVVESPQRVKIAAAVGQRLPAFCTASGKAFMAYLPDAEVRDILGKGLTKHTEHTLLAVTDLYEDLRRTRERGFAISEQEFETDICAVAAPILDAVGYPVAVIAIVGPSFRLPRERMLMLGLSIQATTEAIAHEVGLTALSTIVSKTSTPGIGRRAA
jgi:IclR family transcriptional regulator, KDG regulon repressor